MPKNKRTKLEVIIDKGHNIAHLKTIDKNLRPSFILLAIYLFLKMLSHHGIAFKYIFKKPEDLANFSTGFLFFSIFLLLHAIRAIITFLITKERNLNDEEYKEGPE